MEKCNREWHVIVEHRGLATALRRFLEWDLTTAQRVGPSTDAVPIRALVNMPDVFVSAVPPPAVYRKFFEPKDFEFDAGPEARVLPLLTPDNFIEAITHEIESARDKLYVQNQSLAFLQKQDDQDPRYTKFTRILAEKSHSIRDFRLILRDPQEFFNSREAALTTYRRKGFKADRIRFQPKCHNKGVLVDGQVLLLGSHNLTNAGTTANRDASMVVQNRDVWSRTTRKSSCTIGMPRILRLRADGRDWRSLARWPLPACTGCRFRRPSILTDLVEASF